MRRERHRINITLPVEEYAAAERLAVAGGFKNVCAFTRALLAQVCRYAEQQRMTAQELARQPTTVTEEIADMFRALECLDAATPKQQRAILYANEKTPDYEK
mgnify:CR=1 FL=1